MSIKLLVRGASGGVERSEDLKGSLCVCCRFAMAFEMRSRRFSPPGPTYLLAIREDDCIDNLSSLLKNCCRDRGAKRARKFVSTEQWAADAKSQREEPSSLPTTLSM